MAGTLEIAPRSAWLPSGVPVRTKATTDPTVKKEFFVHHSAFAGMSVDTKEERIATMRAMYHYHVNTQGWADIGYSFVVFQPYGDMSRAKVYEARGWKAIPAAQLNHNTSTIAVCVVSLDEDIKASTVRVLNQLFIKSKCEVVRGHREVTPTSCPGAKLMAVLKDVAKPGDAPSTAPPYPGTPLKRGSRGSNVKLVQKRLKITADGIYGAQTEKAVKDFQRSKKLRVTGAIGSNVWKALFA